MATRAFDHSGRDRPAVGQGGGVVEVGAVGEEEVSATVGVAALVLGEGERGGFAADRGGDDTRFALQNGERFLVYPPFGGGVTFLKEAPGRVPHIFVTPATLQHLREVLPREVRVTACSQPLRGRVLLARGFRRLKGELMLDVVLPDGSAGTGPARAPGVFGGAGGGSRGHDPSP